MDFLDPKKRRRHAAILFTGYILIAVMIILGTIILTLLARGYWVKNGQVIQNGLIFVSSRPAPAQIYLDGSKETKTNARLTLPEGTYDVRLQRDGYRDWQRKITVRGGKVERFDYPVLFPTTLATTPVQTYSAKPGLMSQSRDKRWLLVQVPKSVSTFQLYDLANPSTPPTSVVLPSTVLPASTGAEQLSAVAWADDNKHVLLKRTYNGNKQTEYILLDRTNPSQAIDLTQSLQVTATQAVSLRNQKYDQYYIYDHKAQTLSMATLGQPTQQLFVAHVLDFVPYGSDMVLYATTQGAPKSQAIINLLQGGATYPIRNVPAASSYQMDLTQYSGDWYIAISSPSEGKVYIYKDPADQYNATSAHIETPTVVLLLNHPSFLDVSPDGRFFVAEAGTAFRVYDTNYDHAYSYTLSDPLDKPQTHAMWMDGAHLEYVSRGKLTVLDFDGNNVQTLMPASAAYEPAYDSQYRYAYVLAPTQPATSGLMLSSTALLIPSDL